MSNRVRLVLKHYVISMDTEGQMGNGMEKSGQSDLSSTVEAGLSSRTLKGSKGHQPGLQQEVKAKIGLDLQYFIGLFFNLLCSSKRIGKCCRPFERCWRSSERSCRRRRSSGANCSRPTPMTKLPGRSSGQR